jgi:hypothetical protein
MIEAMLGALKKLRPSQLAIIAGVAVILVFAGIGIDRTVGDGGGHARGERVRAPFGGDGGPGGRDFRHGGPGGPGFRRGDGGPFRGGPGGFGGPGGPGGPGQPGANPNLPQVLMDIKQATAKQASQTAGPILDKAVKDKKITKAEADMIRQRISQMGQGGGPGRGGF